MNVNKYRDLTIIDINLDQLMVIACDSCGGVGNKNYDIVKTTPEIVGFYTTQVALAELIAFGAQPITIVNTLSVEMDDTGQRIIQGVKEALKPLDLDEEMIVTGSTEENFPMQQTGIGVTAIGIINKGSWNKPQTTAGALAILFGFPKVGDEILEDQGNTTVTLPLLKQMRDNPAIQEIIPVGSKGILHEITEMAKSSQVDFRQKEDLEVDLYKSAGPASCAVISVDRINYEMIKNTCPIPVTFLGEFYSRESNSDK